MEKKTLYIFLSLILIIPTVFFTTSCQTQFSGNEDAIVSKVKPEPVDPIDLTRYNADVTDFAVRLFQNTLETEKNTLISPLSVLCALSMTANGADGETLIQMEETFGISMTDLNRYLYTYNKQLPQDKNYKLSLANSIWFADKESFLVNEDFLQTNVTYYNADLFKAAFDETTVKKINNWVDTNTDGMIPTILDHVPPQAVMYLVNALAFDAKWDEVYKETQVHDRTFTNIDGVEESTEMMYSEEMQYLEDEHATGFIKYYEDKKYAFAALLPNENIDIFEYVSNLSGEKLHELLSNPVEVHTQTAIPKFEYEYGIEISNILVNMGIKDAFDSELADFSNLGSSDVDNLFINRVLHKTFISVAEQGTKAGAATVVEKAEGAALIEEIKEVYLDRPFVYMLIDCENHVPFFVGTILDL